MALVVSEPLAPRAPVTLPNGRVVEFDREPSGSQHARMKDGGGMNHEEWDALCRKLSTLTYKVVDRSGAVKGTYRSITRARRARDRLDLVYGAYAHRVVPAT